MSDVPYEPPSIEVAVQQHLDVVHEVRELRREVNHLSSVQRSTNTALTSLAANFGRLADGRTVDSLTLERIERSVTALRNDVHKLLGAEHA